MISLLLALTLTTAAPPPDDSAGEPLPPGAPTDPYELSAWCYGALGEYLAIYDKVKPDLRDIDHMFGTSGVVEDEPYQSDMAAYRVELKLIGDAVTDAEKASPDAISERGVAAMRRGREIWSVAEAKTSRELARAWLGWALPDRCDANARELATRSIVLGKALRYNEGDKAAPPSMTPDTATPVSGHATPPPDTISAAFATALPSGPPAEATASRPPPTSPPVALKSEPPPAVLEAAPSASQAEAHASSEPPTTSPPADAVASEPPAPEAPTKAAIATIAPDAGEPRTAAQAPADTPPTADPTAPPSMPPAAAATGATGPDESQEPTL